MVLVMHYTKLAVVDAHGGGWTGVVNETGDTIQVFGLTHVDGTPLYLENEARYISLWCKDNGLHYVEQQCTDEIEVEG